MAAGQMRNAPGAGLDVQRSWDGAGVRAGWASTPDMRFIVRRQTQLVVALTCSGASGRVLEVAAGEGTHWCELSLAGLETVVVEPSPAMLALARERMIEHGIRAGLVRGIGETLPFRDGTFDRVLCESAIDHFAGPDLGIREMARVCKPDGRLVIGVTNYGSASVRLSRLLYRVARGLGRARRDQTLFWDTPVPYEHSFECTYPLLRRLAGQYCDLVDVVGVSLGWGVPGWAAFLERLGDERASRLLDRLDAIARRVPRWADYVLTVWRPRPTVVDGRDLCVRAIDPAYRSQRSVEGRFWSHPWPRPDVDPGRADVRLTNQCLTGDATRSWLDDVVARGPFETAAALGCDDEPHESAWLRAGATRRLDVYELAAAFRRRWRRGAPRGARFIQVDLNFARLPASRYDVIWSSGCLHHIVNLEHLLDEVKGALRPGGLFVLHDYVGERGLAFDPRRLARVNALLRDVPVRFRRDGIETIVPMRRAGYHSPFCALRSEDVLALARARFDVVHEAYASALFPLFFWIDVAAIAREDPPLLERLVAAEAAALEDPAMRKSEVYVVFRRPD